MGTITGRYDASAEAYERWWAPVLRPSALRLPDLLGVPEEAVLDVLDIGAGSGTLAFEVARRWTRARVTLLDGSEGMLAVAERRADQLTPTSDGLAPASHELAPASDAPPPAAALRERLTFVTALADRLPFPDASFDAVVSSFVMQLVPHRPRVLAEARRVLRPGGTLAYVTWLAGKDDGFAPDDAFYDALDACAIPDELEPEEARSGDVPSVDSAAAQLRRAGFRDVAARREVLVHHFDAPTYPDFLEEYAERETFAALDAGQRRCVRAETRKRLAGLPAEAFAWRAPIVFVRGRRP